MTDSKFLTENELRINLYALKKILNKIELNPIKNVLFFNLDSYYILLENFYDTSLSLAHIMKILEPYVPLSLCIDAQSCKLLMNAAQSENTQEIEKIKNDFYRKAVLEFLYKLKNSSSENEIDYIFNLCNNLRIMQTQ